MFLYGAYRRCLQSHQDSLHSNLTDDEGTRGKIIVS